MTQPAHTLAHAGLPVVLGGVSYTLPTLSARISRQYWSRIVALQSQQEPDPLGLVSTLVHACLLRNYPDLALDVVEDAVDMTNFADLFISCLGEGAFKRWAQEQAAAAGNAASQPTTLAPAGIGAPSTPALLPQQDGATPT